MGTCYYASKVQTVNYSITYIVWVESCVWWQHLLN